MKWLSLGICVLLIATVIFPVARTVRNEKIEISVDGMPAENQLRQNEIKTSNTRGDSTPTDLPQWFYALVNNDWNYWTNPPHTYAIQTGNIGIGTMNPTEKLQVTGIIHSTSGGFKFPDGTVQTTAAMGGGNGGDDDWEWSSGSGLTGSIYHMGNVGIGTTTPARNLHISGPYSYLRFDNTYQNDNYVIGSDATAGFIVWSETDSVYRMVINNDGRVGIGTTSPQGMLHVDAGDDYISGVYSISNHYGVYCAGGAVGVYARGGGSGVLGQSGDSSGVGVEGQGGSSSYDFYASGEGTNYGPFTGAHEVKLADDFPASLMPGMIVTVTGETAIRRIDDGSISFSSTLPTVRLSDSPNDKKVLGVTISEVSLRKDHWYTSDLDGDDRFGIVNALGDGRVWVTNINGNIEAGDYITTSAIAGYGMKQDSDVLHSYTLGKATENVDWTTVTETVEYNDYIYKAYPIGVVYTSG